MVIPLYTPREVEVLANDSGEPAAVNWNNTRRRVAAIVNVWRVDEEWWREEISRQYFRIELHDGLVVTVFHDLIAGRWYRQRY
jgi:hypothetical protein